MKHFNWVTSRQRCVLSNYVSSERNCVTSSDIFSASHMLYSIAAKTYIGNKIYPKLVYCNRQRHFWIKTEMIPRHGICCTWNFETLIQSTIVWRISHFVVVIIFFVGRALQLLAWLPLPVVANPSCSERCTPTFCTFNCHRCIFTMLSTCCFCLIRNPIYSIERCFVSQWVHG
jgi:hypothetical protein